MYGGLTGKARQHQQIVRQGFLWCMTAIYLFAFTSLYVQLPGLYGHDGLLPASYVLHDLSSCADKSSVCSLWASYGECSKNKEWMIENCIKTCNSCHVLDTSFVALFKKTPTLLWVTPYLGLDTTTGMEVLCMIGIILSFVLLISQRCRDCLAYLMLWFLYYSMLPAGQIFIRYQWDALLWESGFLAFLVAPWNIVLRPWRWIFFKCRRYRNVSRHHDSITFWLVKWLLFRLMFASGVVKLTYMDPSWWDLSALNWHYESQCIPTAIAWYFQKLPTWFHRLSVVLTYVIEIGIPFLVFAPVRVLRISAYCSEVFLQLLILLTGNYNFFNLLTIVLCMSLLDVKCILSRIQCFLCRKCACSSCLRKNKQAKLSQTDAKNDGYTELKQEDSTGDCMKNETEVNRHTKEIQDVEAGTSAVSSTEQTAGSDEASASVNVHESDGSTTSQLVEQVLDWINTRHENRKFAQAKEFLHSKSFCRIKMAAICFSSFTVLVVIVVCTVKWFDIRITRKEPVRLEIAFSPEQLVMAVQRATQYAIWIGFISLAIEILGAITRCLLEHCDRRSKVWQFFQCVAFSLVALWMFAVSLYSFSAVDRVVQRSLPKVVVDWYRATEYLELTNAYGLFRSMTGVGGRPEVIIIGSNSLKGPWEEYNFLYKPGNIYQPPPFVAPHQPRLDWQMWFAALESYSENPWFLSLVHKLLLGKKDVMQLMGRGPFDESPPQFIRAQLYLYHYTQNTSSLSDLLLHQDRGEKAWWTREFVRDYLPFTASNSSLSDLEEILEKSGVYRPSFKVEVTWGILHPLIRDLRRVHRQMAPTTLINAILFMVVTCLVLKVWWRRTGRKFCTPSLIRVRDKTENLLKTSSKKLNPNMEKTVNKPSSACAGNCACCVKCADKFCEAYKHLSKKLTICWEMTQSKFTERINRCKAVWKNRMPSVKKKA